MTGCFDLCFLRRDRPSRCLFVAALVLATTPAAWAASPTCEVPTLGPVDTVVGATDDGRHLHIVTGTAAVCDMTAARRFDVVLPGLHDIGAASAQIALGGFTRRYGVHQIGFVLSSVETKATPGGVTVSYTAAIDGLDHYQIAYTLYLTARP